MLAAVSFTWAHMSECQLREARAAAEGGYDPVEGRGCCGPRELVDTPVEGLPRAFVPRAMTADPSYGSVRHDTAGWRRLRCRHDFEYWCAACVCIKHKTLGHDVPFVLNAPQRRVAAMLEADRRAGPAFHRVVAPFGGGACLAPPGVFSEYSGSVHDSSMLRKVKSEPTRPPTSITVWRTGRIRKLIGSACRRLPRSSDFIVGVFSASAMPEA